MTEMAEKKGKLKLTVEVEVNEELMDLAKDTISKMPMRMQEMWKGGHGKERVRAPAYSSVSSLIFPTLIFSYALRLC